MEDIKLSLRKKEILRYSVRGYAINDISEKACISPDTVKFHRKNFLEKLGVSTIYEAISYATTYNLL